MKNYKNIFIKSIKYWTSKDNLYKNEYTNEAALLIETFMSKRFENELRQYNNDSNKAYDEFIAKKNLDLLRYYIEEFYFLDKKEITKKHLAIRKQMRYIYNNLYSLYIKE